MKFEIKRWWDAKVLFEAEIPDDTEECFRIKFAVELAVKAGASLDGASLDGASLVRASLVRASLVRASLDSIKNDYWAVLCTAPHEVKGVRQALIDGKVDGSTYTGECACLIGTIANLRGADHQSLGALKPDSSRPAERFFMGINEGDTPETNQLSKIALGWTDEWLANMGAFLAAQPKA